jgi:hypothetical protein
MRLLFAFALLVGSAALAQQPKAPDLPDQPQPRYGVPPKLKTYPQNTAKKALASALEAIEKPDLAYLAAQLLDPGYVDLRVGERAKQFEAATEVELARLRDFQIRNPEKFQPQDRLPVDRGKFRALVSERSREQGFRQVVKDLEDKLRDDPQSLRDLKKMFRAGTVEDTATGARVTHPDIKDRALFFRKVGDRWFLENQQEEAPPAKKEP